MAIKNMKVNGKIINAMARVCNIGRTGRSFMMASGKKMKNMVMVCVIGIVAVLKGMLVNGKTGSVMVKAYATTRMEQFFTMVNGKMMIDMVMAYCIIEMEQSNVKANGKMI
jgi:hypothetical protein